MRRLDTCVNPGRMRASLPRDKGKDPKERLAPFVDAYFIIKPRLEE
jgi:hypothetical protein